eukprot:UN04487
MALILWIFVLMTIAFCGYSNTLVCNETICNFGICDANTNCNNNEYICTDEASICSLECNSNCYNISITSVAQNTDIMCNNDYSCDTVSVSILNANNILSFACKQLSSCSNINIQCHPQAICEGSGDVFDHKMNVGTQLSSKTTMISVTLFWLTTCI